MNKRVLIVVGGGGFFNETIPFIKELSRSFMVSLLVAGDVSKELVNNLDIDQVSYIAPLTQRNRKGVNNLLSIAPALVDAYRSLNKHKPNVVLCVGSSLAIPVFYVSKLMLKKTIFIESIARVESLSNTGKFIHKLNLYNKFYVQWPDLEDRKNSILYKGGIL